MGFGIIIGWSARASRICHLRPDQSCDVQPMASRSHRRRYGLGTFVTALASLAGFVAIRTFAPIE